MTEEDLSNIAGARPGDVLAGKYRIERVLGAGGMGVVVAAYHLQLDERVALKFLLPNIVNPEAVSRFSREAQASVKIKSEHVARVTDVGQLENGSPYMVMEYLEGEDLSRMLRSRGPLACEQAVEFVLQACEALADAHTLGIVHRDLKPANLFCIRRADGTLSVKVLDFGISKRTDTGGAPMALTRTTALMGSPMYMSPEQMKSAKNVDARADIWAIGVVLFELISGRLPFLADTLMELTMLIATEHPPPLSSVRPDVPPGLDAVVARCLEKNVDLRYRNVAELASALLPFGGPRARVSVERIAGTLQERGSFGGSQSVPQPDGLPATSPVARTSLLPPGSIPPSAIAAAATAPSSNTHHAIGRTTGGAASPRSKAAVVGVGLAIALTVVGAFAVVKIVEPLLHGRSRTAANPPAAPAAIVAPPGPAVAGDPAVSVATPSVAPQASLSAPAEASAHPVVEASAPSFRHDPPLRPPPAAHATAAPAATPAASPPPVASVPPPATTKPNADCNPAFTYDQDGNKIWKLDCVPK